MSWFLIVAVLLNPAYELVPSNTQKPLFELVDDKSTIIGYTLGDGCVPCKRAASDDTQGNLSVHIEWKAPPDWYIKDFVEKHPGEYGFPAFHWKNKKGMWVVKSGYLDAKSFNAMLNHAEMEMEMAVAGPKTGVCRCRGSNEGVCFCRQRGVVCRCNASTGSVWTLDTKNKPIAKTGQYANPNTAAPAGTNKNAPRTTDQAPGSSVGGRWVLQRQCTRRGCFYNQVWVPE